MVVQTRRRGGFYLRGAEGEERLALFRRVLTNAESMLNRPPTAWQLGK